MYEFLIGLVNGFLTVVGVEVEMTKAAGEFTKELIEDCKEIYNESDE